MSEEKEVENREVSGPTLFDTSLTLRARGQVLRPEGAVSLLTRQTGSHRFAGEFYHRDARLWQFFILPHFINMQRAFSPSRASGYHIILRTTGLCIDLAFHADRLDEAKQVATRFANLPLPRYSRLLPLIEPRPWEEAFEYNTVVMNGEESLVRVNAETGSMTVIPGHTALASIVAGVGTLMTWHLLNPPVAPQRSGLRRSRMFNRQFDVPAAEPTLTGPDPETAQLIADAEHERALAASMACLDDTAAELQPQLATPKATRRQISKGTKDEAPPPNQNLRVIIFD